MVVTEDIIKVIIEVEAITMEIGIMKEIITEIEDILIVMIIDLTKVVEETIALEAEIMKEIEDPLIIDLKNLLEVLQTTEVRREGFR